MFQETDMNKFISLMAMDQSVAFDCINIEILLRKLKMYKCSDNTLLWMNSYLSRRSNYVSMGRQQSEMKAVYRAPYWGPSCI